ncbi:MAG: hypothetical protein AB9866_26315 [Syntrophobacteraceae bacterium]
MSRACCGRNPFLPDFPERRSDLDGIDRDMLNALSKGYSMIETTGEGQGESTLGNPEFYA